MQYDASSSEAESALADERLPTGGVGSQHLKSSKFDVRSPLAARIVVNRELHSDESDRSCRHIEIETNGVLAYEVGDHVGIFAENDPAMVEHVAKRLGYGCFHFLFCSVLFLISLRCV